MPGPDPSSQSTLSLVTPPRLLGSRHRLVMTVDGVQQVFPLPQVGTVVVGRSRPAEIRLSSTAVSRQHARLEIEPGAVLLADLNSHNGIWVNGERLSGQRLLSYGDIVTFGDVVAFFDQDTGQEAVNVDDMMPLGPTLDLDGVSVLIEDLSMQQVYLQIQRLARSDLAVLITGETGTGKELAARALRHWSKRSEQPLVSINCAALPEGIAESELFGYERGAFSGAAGAKVGLLESAPGGTVFLDEIGDLSLTVQAKLLRVLENHCITRLGSVRERPCDVRVISATHRNLLGEVRARRFRQDLYYRLSAGVVHLPPLRLRQKELPILARRFLEAARRQLGRPSLEISEAALDSMNRHPWPGNVRELKNLMEYVAAVVDGPRVELEHVGIKLAERGNSSGVPLSGVPLAAPSGVPLAAPSAVLPTKQSLGESTRGFERQQIEAALAATGRNKTRAARLLGVPLRTFMDKVKRYGVE